MAAVVQSPQTIYSWRDICERVDGPNRHLDSLYPTVYYWNSGAARRDSGPNSGIYKPGPAPVGPTDIGLAGSLVQEQVVAAPVGAVTVIGPNVAYVFTVIDDTDAAIHWVVDGGLLRLADGQQVLYADNTQHIIEVTATAPNALFVTVEFVINVQQQIIPPPPNHAPTGIALDNLTVNEKVNGAFVGNITVSDVDLPSDTETIVCTDSRFVVIPGGTPGTATLRLQPATQLVFATTPSVSLTLTATDSGGLFVTVPFTITVIPQSPPPGRAHSAGFSTGFN